MIRWVAIALATALLSFAVIAQQSSRSAEPDAHFYTAERLAADCVSRKPERTNGCFGVMYGVLHTLLFLDNEAPFKGVLCLPPLSAATVKDTFLAAYYSDRHGLTGMLAGAAVAYSIYERYPCDAEKLRRKREGEKALRELMQEAK